MPSFRVRRKASADLVSIYLYGAEKFGQPQAEFYQADLESCFQLLSEHPRMGRERIAGMHHVRVFFHRSHLIVYQEDRGGIDIVRVLGGRQDWPHILEDDGSA
jgi:toxin ParE1/3/4